MLYHLDAAGPVSVHGSVLVMETLQLELQVRPPHQGLVNLGTIVIIVIVMVIIVIVMPT